jgi:hypothetical protein
VFSNLEMCIQLPTCRMNHAFIRFMQRNTLNIQILFQAVAPFSPECTSTLEGKRKKAK